MLVSGEGLLSPLAYGAQGKRSVLRGTAVPYNRGIADLHYDGVKNRWRLTAFDPEDTHDGLREDLDRFYQASTWAEILLKTHGAGGDSAELYELAASAFSILSRSESLANNRLDVAFMWQFLEIEGVQPDLKHCGRCGRALNPGADEGPLRFLPNGLLAGPECAESRWPILHEGAVKWLLNVSGGNLEASLKIGLAPIAVGAARNWLLTIIQTLLERPLRSIQG